MSSNPVKTKKEIFLDRIFHFIENRETKKNVNKTEIQPRAFDPIDLLSVLWLSTYSSKFQLGRPADRYFPFQIRFKNTFPSLSPQIYRYSALPALSFFCRTFY
jgi:hypothetical protein